MRIVLIRPERESAVVASRVVSSEAHTRGLSTNLTVLRTARVRLVGESPERKAEVLGVQDAAGLYRSLHRASVLVLAFTAVYVRRDPSRDPPARRASVPLEMFVGHKGVFGLVRREADIERHLVRYAAWPGAQRCRGEDDPRILPLHVFDTSQDWRGLPDPTAERAFEKLYGGPRKLRDEGAKEWQRAHHYHGSDPLTVGGCELKPGLHWDVSPATRKATLHTTNEVWHLSNPGAYLNVYPDAEVRLTRRVSGVKRVWPRR